MNPIAIFYHTLFELGNPPQILPHAISIVREQMAALEGSGLLDACDKFVVGINGDEKSREIANLIIPAKAEVVCHGHQCRNEIRTIRMIEQWLPSHPGWLVLYLHSKGATHPPGDDSKRAWRECGMKHLVGKWRECVQLLETVESVGCHWMEPPMTPPSQYIWAGNMWWSRSDYLMTLPSILDRTRIKDSGIDSLESRYESEVWIGNGSRKPTLKDWCPNWNPSRPHVR